MVVFDPPDPLPEGRPPARPGEGGERGEGEQPEAAGDGLNEVQCGVASVSGFRWTTGLCARGDLGAMARRCVDLFFNVLFDVLCNAIYDQL